MLTFIPLTGFLGAGKTTTMTASARLLGTQGKRVAIITNDQGVELVDSKTAGAAVDQVGEVTGGCFCCKFEDLESLIRSLAADGRADTIIAEAVGSCTDLQATVVRPLRAQYQDQVRVAPLTTVVDPHRLTAFEYARKATGTESDLGYLFRQQLLEADIILLNKVDLLRPEQLQRAMKQIADINPTATRLVASAASGQGLDSLVRAWAESARNSSVYLDVDYDRYAAAEAALAWLNDDVEIEYADDFDAGLWASDVLRYVSTWATERNVVIGHAKVTVDVGADFAKASLTAAGDEPALDRRATLYRAGHTRAIVNARVACEPEDLDAVVAAAIQASTWTQGAKARSRGALSFKPGYPTPVHRIMPDVHESVS